MKTRALICIVFICLHGISAGLGNADELDWPRWRGPNGDGISKETDWNPEALAGGPKILWTVDIGLGHSNVAIKGKYIYTIGNKNREDTVYCLKVKNGKKVWQYSYESPFEPPQATPTVDQDSVYILSKTGKLFSLNAKNGKVRWEKDLVSEYDIVKPYYGFAGSPIIEGGLLILTANTYGLALYKNTGNKFWGSVKPLGDLRMVCSTGPHYATPVMYDYEGKKYVVISSYIGLHAVDVDTGKVFWLYKWEPLREVQTTDPLIFDKYVFITQYDEKYGSVLLEIEGGEPKVLWESLDMESNISSPVMVDGYIYGVDGGPYPQRGSLQCLDAKTGELMWEDKLNGKPISLTATDGKLIVLDEEGTLFIAEVTPASYKEISSGDVLEGKQNPRQFWTPPVLYKGKIYVRNFAGDLVCIDVSK